MSAVAVGHGLVHAEYVEPDKDTETRPSLRHAAANAFRPEYRYWDMYFDSESYALSYDTLPSVHPMSRTAKPIASLADIDNMFDAISYDKVWLNTS